MNSRHQTEHEIIAMIFDAIEEGNALNIETSRRTLEDCAVLATTEEIVTVSAVDLLKNCEHEFDIAWNDIVKVSIY
jgi:hypothetical protein